MDTSDLKAACIGLYAELEAMTTMEKNLKLERKKITSQLQTIKFRKAEYKNMIEYNLNQQEPMWDVEYPKVDPLEEIDAVEDYLTNPDQPLHAIANRHRISESTLSRRLSNHLKIA